MDSTRMLDNENGIFILPQKTKFSPLIPLSIAAVHHIPLPGSTHTRFRSLSTKPSKATIANTHALQRRSKDLPSTITGPRGRDLSQRYAQLERSLPWKEEFVKHQAEIQGSSVVVAEDPTDKDFSVSLTTSTHLDTPLLPSGTSSGSLGPPVETLRGFVIPEKPKSPADDECCMSGCAICVYDLYEESLQSYEESLSTVRSNLRALGISEADWPVSVRPKSSGGEGAGGGAGERKAQALSAFEELEKSLQAKQAAPA